MSTARGVPIADQVIKVLYENGPKKAGDMRTWIKFPYKSIYQKCLDLQKMGLVSKDDQSVWTITPGVTPKTLETGEREPPGSHKPVGGDGTTDNPPKDKTPPDGETPAGGATGMALDPRALFEQTMKSVAVKPPEVIPTIANVFFGGDIDNLQWLHDVLRRHASGFVAPNQIRLIISAWSTARGLPYDENEFPLEGFDKGKSVKPGEKEETKTGAAKLMADAGIGWKVVKDKDGDWVAQPGGTMSQEEATAAAERRATIAAMGLGVPAASSEETPESGDGKPVPKTGKGSRSFQDIFMEKAIDHFFDKDKTKDGEDSPTIKALTVQVQQANQTIQQLKDQQEKEWKEKMEANLAAIASRDPWSDPTEIARARQLLNIPSTTVTDNSPAVQVLKDSTEKIDKNVGRLVGLIERVALKSDEFRPEERRSSAEKEAKAGDLLNEAAERERARALRLRTFGV